MHIDVCSRYKIKKYLTILFLVLYKVICTSKGTMLIILISDMQAFHKLSQGPRHIKSMNREIQTLLLNKGTENSYGIISVLPGRYWVLLG